MKSGDGVRRNVLRTVPLWMFTVDRLTLRGSAAAAASRFGGRRLQPLVMRIVT
jgi:hypothetical protein